MRAMTVSPLLCALQQAAAVTCHHPAALLLGKHLMEARGTWPLGSQTQSRAKRLSPKPPGQTGIPGRVSTPSGQRSGQQVTLALNKTWAMIKYLDGSIPEMASSSKVQSLLPGRGTSLQRPGCVPHTQRARGCPVTCGCPVWCQEVPGTDGPLLDLQHILEAPLLLLLCTHTAVPSAHRIYDS